jgi:hypothetical protein
LDLESPTKLRGFSYYTQSHAYLEEDCDAPTFIKAVEQHGNASQVEYGRYSGL